VFFFGRPSSIGLLLPALLGMGLSAAVWANGALKSTSTTDSPTASPLTRKSRRVIFLSSMIFHFLYVCGGKTIISATNRSSAEKRRLKRKNEVFLVLLKLYQLVTLVRPPSTILHCPSKGLLDALPHNFFKIFFLLLSPIGSMKLYVVEPTQTL